MILYGFLKIMQLFLSCVFFLTCLMLKIDHSSELFMITIMTIIIYSESDWSTVLKLTFMLALMPFCLANFCSSLYFILSNFLASIVDFFCFCYFPVSWNGRLVLKTNLRDFIGWWGKFGQDVRISIRILLVQLTLNIWLHFKN